MNDLSAVPASPGRMSDRASPKQLMWRYSLRWCLPHRPCPGSLELVVMEVPAGTTCPPEMRAAWDQRPQGYGLCIDFPQSEVVRRWSAEAKGRVRRSKLAKRIEKAAPLIVDELLERELKNRPDYFDGL